MGQRDRWESNGPSYRDVDAHAQELRDRYGVGIRWGLVPPIDALGGRGRTSWGVTVEVWTLRSKERKWYHAQAFFGQGGAWKTLPAALLATLRAFEEQKADEERAALAQQRF